MSSKINTELLEAIKQATQTTKEQSVVVSPNPNSNFFTLKLTSRYATPVITLTNELKIDAISIYLDITGKHFGDISHP